MRRPEGVDRIPATRCRRRFVSSCLKTWRNGEKLPSKVSKHEIGTRLLQAQPRKAKPAAFSGIYRRNVGQSRLLQRLIYNHVWDRHCMPRRRLATHWHAACIMLETWRLLLCFVASACFAQLYHMVRPTQVSKTIGTPNQSLASVWVRPDFACEPVSRDWWRGVWNSHGL
jgi:hypothetical protein